MADSILVQRIASRLREASEATPKGEGFWSILADIAATEAARPTVPVLTRPPPALPVIALGKRREAFVRLVDGATVDEVAAQVTPLFDAGNRDEVWIVDVKRILVIRAIDDAPSGHRDSPGDERRRPAERRSGTRGDATP